MAKGRKTVKDKKEEFLAAKAKTSLVDFYGGGKKGREVLTGILHEALDKQYENPDYLEYLEKHKKDYFFPHELE